MSNSVKYPLADSLAQNPVKHCAALVISENIVTDPNGWPRFAQPSDELRNGTLTFVAYGGRVFGVTCWHVIEHYRGLLKVSERPFSHSLRTMVNGFYPVLDRFIRPQPQYGDPDVDIAIRELNPEFPAAIGKVPIDLGALATPPASVGHAYAVGFPETAKYKRLEDQMGYRVSMPHVAIVTPLENIPTRRFTLYGELPKRPDHVDYSGMSGGPIFWSSAESYGILGLIYEGGIGSEASEGATIYVYGEVATPEAIQGWIDQV